MRRDPRIREGGPDVTRSGKQAQTGGSLGEDFRGKAMMPERDGRATRQITKAGYALFWISSFPPCSDINYYTTKMKSYTTHTKKNTKNSFAAGFPAPFRPEKHRFCRSAKVLLPGPLSFVIFPGKRYSEHGRRRSMGRAPGASGGLFLRRTA